MNLEKYLGETSVVRYKNDTRNDPYYNEDDDEISEQRTIDEVNDLTRKIVDILNNAFSDLYNIDFPTGYLTDAIKQWLEEVGE